MKHSWRWASSSERGDYKGMAVQICNNCGLLHARYPGAQAAKMPHYWRRANSHQIVTKTGKLPCICERILNFQI